MQRRLRLEERGQSHLLAVRLNQHLRFVSQHGLLQTDPAELATTLAADDWQALSAGEGAKGPRLFDWARRP